VDRDEERDVAGELVVVGRGDRPALVRDRVERGHRLLDRGGALEVRGRGVAGVARGRGGRGVARGRGRCGARRGAAPPRGDDRRARCSHDASAFGRTTASTHSTISWLVAPGVKIFATPISASGARSSFGMIPPPNTTTPPAPRAVSAAITAGNSVMCAPDMI